MFNRQLHSFYVSYFSCECSNLIEPLHTFEAVNLRNKLSTWKSGSGIYLSV